MSASAPRDLDRALEAFLDAGPNQLSNRLALSIADEVHRTRQRASRGPWRIPSMSRFALTVAAVAVAAVVAGMALIVMRPSSNTGVTHSQPATQSAAPSASPAVPSVPLGILNDGGTYGTTAATFSQPFTVTLPRIPADLASSIRGDLLGGNTHNLRIRPAVGAITIHDDAVLPADLCHPDNGFITDVPATPQAVGTWLAKGLTVSSAVQMTVDGRVALRWDVFVPKTGCTQVETPAGSPAIWFNPGEHHRVYAIPTGTDTILVITWGAGYQGEGEQQLPEINTWTDSFVQALRFP